MKTFIVAILLSSLFSCTENETHCFTCSTAEAGQVTEFTRCDITEKEADDIERAGLVLDPDFYHPAAGKIDKYTVCTKAN